MSEPRTVAEGERRVLATVTRLMAAAHRRVFRGSGSVDELYLNPRVQHIGSHPHSPGRCGRRPAILDVLTEIMPRLLPQIELPRFPEGRKIFVYLLSRTFFPMAVRTYSSC
jgi:hypothetical protein